MINVTLLSTSLALGNYEIEEFDYCFLPVTVGRLGSTRFYEREKRKDALGAVDDDDMDF